MTDLRNRLFSYLVTSKVARKAFFAFAIGIAYLLFLIFFAYSYQQQFHRSLDTALGETAKISKQAAWRIAIGLYVQNHPNGVRQQHDSGIEYRSSTYLAPTANHLAFLFSTPSRFVADNLNLRNEVHITGNLGYDGSSGGPAKSMPTGPWYVITSWYQYFPYGSSAEKKELRFNYSEDPLAYSRFPVELAPSGIFEGGSYSPPIGFSKSYRFSARAPDEVFRKEIANHVEQHLMLLVEEEYEKWRSIGRFSNFLYFAATFGLGEINPNSPSVRQLLVMQIIASVVVGALLIPGLLSYARKKLRVVLGER